MEMLAFFLLAAFLPATLISQTIEDSSDLWALVSGMSQNCLQLRKPNNLIPGPGIPLKVNWVEKKICSFYDSAACNRK